MVWGWSDILLKQLNIETLDLKLSALFSPHHWIGLSVVCLVLGGRVVQGIFLSLSETYRVILGN